MRRFLSWPRTGITWYRYHIWDLNVKLQKQRKTGGFKLRKGCPCGRKRPANQFLDKLQTFGLSSSLVRPNFILSKMYIMTRAFSRITGLRQIKIVLQFRYPICLRPTNFTTEKHQLELREQWINVFQTKTNCCLKSWPNSHLHQMKVGKLAEENPTTPVIRLSK